MPFDPWPLAHLRLHTPRLTLKLPDPDELIALANVAAGGLHRPDERPFLTPWTERPPQERALSVMQGQWASQGEWTPESWALALAVLHEGQPIGRVTLRAGNFTVLREVKTTSWLGLEHHGQGLGTEARAAVLTLAFNHLGAEAALTEVFQDNAASQGVSRKLGYRPDGISRDVRDGEVLVSDRLRLTRENWQGLPGTPVTVEGLDACRHFFLRE